MNPATVGIRSLVAAYDALGLPEQRLQDAIPPDVTLDDILAKITNPGIAADLGASETTFQAIHHMELIANLLDAYSETGERTFLHSADAEYQKCLRLLPPEIRALVQLRGAAALSYFQYEQDVALRIQNGERFLEQEVVEYLLRRGSDSPLYTAILLVDNISGPALTAGFRLRQALWDLADDIRDVEQDRRTIGANVLLMSTVAGTTGLRTLADSLYEQGRELPLPMPLQRAIGRQYERTIAALN